MYKIILIFSLMFLTSCASNYKMWDSGLKTTVVIKQEPFNKSIILDYTYANGIEQYKKMIKEGRINEDLKYSCFHDKEITSVNYIHLIPEDIKYFRSLHISENKTIQYQKVEGFVDNEHARIYKETTNDKLEVYSRKCIIGEFYVTSEVYL